MLRGCEEVVGAVRLLRGPPGVLNPCLIAKVVLRGLNIQLYFGAGRLYFGAGETPTPQENLVIVEQASCLFLRMVKDVRLINLVFNYIVALKYCKARGIFKVCRQLV